MIERVIIAGGGTGGHLFPGIAVLEELRRREPHVEVLFVGTARGIEARVVPSMGERLECIEVSPLKGQGAWGAFRSLTALPRAGAQALSILRRFAPDLVLGVGGYAAGPVVLAAAATGIATALLEQNAHVGVTNRALAHLVGRAYLSYEKTRIHFPNRVVRVVGNPVRRDFVRAGRLAQMEPAAFEMRARGILVVGGSQGAQALNDTVPEALAKLGVGRRGLRVTHQTGRAACEAVAARYRELGVPADVVPFIDDMASAYRAASLVIARAGASTLAELCAIGRPAVLIPYPFAADDHQWHNACALQDAGAAVAIRQSELTVDGLKRALMGVLDDPKRRIAMGDAARAMGRPDAAASIVDDLCGWLGCGSGDGSEEGGGDTEPDPAGAQSDASGDPSTAPLTRGARPSAARRRRRRGPDRRRSFAWDHGDRYFGARSVAFSE